MHGKQQRQAFRPARAAAGAPSARKASRAVVRCQASMQQDASELSQRRQVLLGGAGIALASLITAPRPAGAEAPPQPKGLCEDECLASLESKELVTLPSGLQYRDVVVGSGPTPPTGFQVVVNYVAMTPNGRIFDSSVEKGKPYDIRVGGGQVIPGLDEGLKTMRAGGLRRLYIPGNLAFPKGLKAAAGRPTVPPASPVVFDVQLLYIPGLEQDDE